MWLGRQKTQECDDERGGDIELDRVSQSCQELGKNIPGRGKDEVRDAEGGLSWGRKTLVEGAQRALGKGASRCGREPAQAGPCSHGKFPLCPNGTGATNGQIRAAMRLPHFRAEIALGENGQNGGRRQDSSCPVQTGTGDVCLWVGHGNGEK